MYGSSFPLFFATRAHGRARARPNRKKKGISRSRSILSFLIQKKKKPPPAILHPRHRKKKRLWRKLRDPRLVDLSSDLLIARWRDRAGSLGDACIALHCISFLFLSFFLIEDSIVENSKNVHPQKKTSLWYGLRTIIN